MRSHLRTALALGTLCALGASAAAHDFWIEPSSFRPAAQERVSFELLVGEPFQGEVVARSPDRILRFAAVRPAGGEVPIPGLDGRAPAGYLRPSEAGLWWIAYQSRPSPLELDAEKFEQYLVEEGLERILEVRRARGESAKPGRERYSRCAKSMLQVGTGPFANFDRRVGLPLEIVPESLDAAPKVGGKLSLRVLWGNAGIEGALVGCASKEQPGKETRARTDARGRVEFVLDRPGTWLLHTVHMVPAEKGSDADWESTWASLSFEVRG